MGDNGKEDAVGCEITRKRTLGKGGGADKRGGAHSRYQFFRCGKIGGADKRWGALWRYSTVHVADNAFCIAVVCNRILVLVNLITFQMNIIYVSRTACGGYYACLQVRVSIL